MMSVYDPIIRIQPELTDPVKHILLESNPPPIYIPCNFVASDISEENEGQYRQHIMIQKRHYTSNIPAVLLVQALAPTASTSNDLILTAARKPVRQMSETT